MDFSDFLCYNASGVILMKLLFTGVTSEEICYFGEHSHDCWEIVVVTGGCCRVKAENRVFELRRGAAYVIPPGIKHTTYSDTPFTDAYIHIDKLGFNTDGIADFPEIQDLPELFQIIHRLYLKRNGGYSLSLENMLQAVVGLLYDSVGELKLSALSVAVRNRLIEELENSKTCMKTISNEFGYNIDYISRCFKEDFGTTPMKYLNELRMDRARKLLTEMPFYSVEEIARLCGYRDPFYFSRAFKNATSLSPQKYKNTFKNTL